MPEATKQMYYVEKRATATAFYEVEAESEEDAREIAESDSRYAMEISHVTELMDFIVYDVRDQP